MVHGGIRGIVKVKCTIVEALRLCTGRMAHRGSRGIAVLFLDHGTKTRWVVSVTPQPLFTPGRDPVPIVQEAGWAPGPVWTGVENLTPTGFRYPDYPACSQSLYRLRLSTHKQEYHHKHQGLDPFCVLSYSCSCQGFFGLPIVLLPCGL